MVVDHTDFKMSGFKVRDVPIQHDRAKDILKDEPKKMALKMLYKRESFKGKDYSYKPTPISIMNTGPYQENAATNALLRRTDTTKFVTMADVDTDDSKAVPQDFVRHIHRDARAPKLLTLITKGSEVTPAPLEKVGPKWGASGHNLT